MFRFWWSCSRCLLEFFKLYLHYVCNLAGDDKILHDITFAVALHTLSQDHVCATISVSRTGVASLNVENTFAVYVQFLQDLFGLLQRTKKQKTRPFLMANYLGPSMLHHLGSVDWRRMTNTPGVKFAKCQAQKCKMSQNASSKMPTCTAFHTAMCNA